MAGLSSLEGMIDRAWARLLDLFEIDSGAARRRSSGSSKEG